MNLDLTSQLARLGAADSKISKPSQCYRRVLALVGMHTSMQGIHIVSAAALGGVRPVGVLLTGSLAEQHCGAGSPTNGTSNGSRRSKQGVSKPSR